MGQVADLLDLGTSEAKRTEIPEDNVVVGSLGLELVIVLHEGGGELARVGNDSGSVLLEGRGVDLLESNGNGGNGLENMR